MPTRRLNADPLSRPIAAPRQRTALDLIAKGGTPVDPMSTARAGAEAISKLPLLLDREGIDRDDPERWLLLALKLALLHEPGFQIKSETQPPGRPEKWGAVELARFWWTVEKRRAESRAARPPSTRKICEALAKEAGAKNPTAVRSRAKTLENRFVEAEESVFVKMVTLARQRGPVDAEGYRLFEKFLGVG